MPKIKICGVTTLENALEVADCDIHAIGLNFYHKSKRKIDINIAKKICQKLPPFISKIGLFVNHTDLEVKDIINKVKLDILQFHGNETPKFCESFNIPYIKAVGVDDKVDLIKFTKKYINAIAILVDKKDNNFGGMGKTFNWSLLKQQVKQQVKPIILAGGISENNVLDAVNTLNPYAIDIASGVENNIKGIKDIDKIKEIIKKINKH